MDRSLTTLITDSAKHLLSTSDRFEPFLPHSLSNAIQGLHLLEGLASLTRFSLEVQKQATQKLISIESQAATPTPSKSTQDKSLLEALIQAQKSKSSFRRTPGIFSPILRPQLT